MGACCSNDDERNLHSIIHESEQHHSVIQETEQRFSIIHKLDQQLGQYYAARNRDDYFDENGKGKILVHCEQTGMAQEAQQFLEQEAEFYHPITVDFPDFSVCLEQNLDEHSEREYQFLHLIKHFRQHQNLPSDVELADNYPSISWEHIAQCVKHEMYPLLGTKIASTSAELMSSRNIYDLSADRVSAVIATLTKKVSTRELHYIKDVVSRTKENKIIKYLPKNNITMDSADNTGDFSTKWKGLNPQLLLDVYAVHKCHRYTFQRMSNYPLSEFTENVVKSEELIFGDVGLSEFVQSQKFKTKADALCLYPSRIINDNIFSIISIIHGVTEFVNRFRKMQDPIWIHAYVIPPSIVSVYDRNYHFDIEFPTLTKYVQQKGVTHFAREVVEASMYKVADISKLVQDLCKEVDAASRNAFNDDIIILIDRQNCNLVTKPSQEIMVFRSAVWSSFAELRNNHLIGFDIQIDGVTKAYLNYGIGQRIRFYPEYMVSLVPKLFVTPSDVSHVTEYELFRKLYSAEYKKGWRVNLDDEDFNVIYKAITGYNHETNNYHRPKDANGPQKTRFLQLAHNRFAENHGKHGATLFTNLRSYLAEQRYDSDAVIQDVLNHDIGEQNCSNIAKCLQNQVQSEFYMMTLKHAVFDWEPNECGIKKVLKLHDCLHAQRLVLNLQKFQELNFEINEVNMKHFNLGQVIRDFDHLVAVHNVLSGDDTVHFEQYIENHICCGELSQCVVLEQFRRSRRREGNHSSLKRKQKDGLTTCLSNECAVLWDALLGVHCYLLHRTDELYRLSSGDEEKRFTSTVPEESGDNDEDHAPLSIDFGVSVLQWLPFGVHPLFQSLRQEMVQNEDSTIDHDIYDRTEMECIHKIDSEQFGDYTLDELMGLKFYSDLSKLTALLRKAHWKSIPLEMKGRYYHWARSIYLAALRHAVPIQSNDYKVASWLYHGLNVLFRMDKESPTYLGPISTTLSRNVANTFTKEQGIRLRVKSGYADSMNRCLGINMQSISCFRHEQEVLLVDQPLPIESSKVYKTTVSDLVDHLMFSLKSRATAIRDSRLFWKKLGVRYKKEWNDSIARHQQLYKVTKYQKKTVIERLIEELGMEALMGVILSQVRIHDNVEGKWLNVRFHLENEEFHRLYQLALVFQNVTKNNPNKIRETYNFDVKGHRIPIDELMTTTSAMEVENIKDAFGEISISFQVDPLRNIPLQRIYYLTPIHCKTISLPFVTPHTIYCKAGDFYLKQNVYLLPFDDSTNRGGTLNVVSTSSIIIEKDGGISGSGCGLLEDSKYLNQSLLKYGRFYKQLDAQREVETVNETGGGVIALFAAANVVNTGKLCCDSSLNPNVGGGTILIVSGGKFENDGLLSCKEGGNIRILCRQLVNHGLIVPPPTVQIMDGMKTESYVEALSEMKNEVMKDRDFTTALVDIGGHWIWNRNEEEFLVRTLFSILKVRSTEITNAETFWTNFGSYSKSQWIRMIVVKGSDMLLEKTAYENMLIRQRLVDELKLDVDWKKAAGTMDERMSLNVLGHRGHFADRHPRYLLESGTSECYNSYGCGPPNKDWIIFQKNGGLFIPMSIGIRNGWGLDADIKRILIEGSVDNKHYEHWVEIGGIKKGSVELQSFELDMSSSLKAVEKECKFFKLSILENHGSVRGNEFDEFVIFGSSNGDNNNSMN